MATIEEQHKREIAYLKMAKDFCKENNLLSKVDVVAGGIVLCVWHENGQAIKREEILDLLNMPFQVSFVSVNKEKQPCIYFNLERYKL